MSEVHESHGGTKLYWVFCVILCAITGLEWAIFEYREAMNLTKVMLVSSLSTFSLIKFVMVVGWYMHLRYDPRLLKNLFVFSLLLIGGIAAGLMATGTSSSTLMTKALSAAVTCAERLPASKSV